MPWLVYLAIMLISTAVTIMLAPKPEQPKPASLTDFTFPTAEPGRMIPIVFGTYTIQGPNVIWFGDLASKAIKTKSGKK